MVSRMGSCDWGPDLMVLQNRVRKLETGSRNPSKHENPSFVASQFVFDLNLSLKILNYVMRELIEQISCQKNLKESKGIFLFESRKKIREIQHFKHSFDFFVFICKLFTSSRREPDWLFTAGLEFREPDFMGSLDLGAWTLVLGKRRKDLHSAYQSKTNEANTNEIFEFRFFLDRSFILRLIYVDEWLYIAST